MHLMHYYKHHIGDYRRDTGHLSLLEHAAYRQLLDNYYLDELGPEDDFARICRRIGARAADERAAVRAVLDDFFELSDGRWRHGRCDMELAEYHRRAETARVNGRAGGRPSQTDVEATSIPVGTQSVPIGGRAEPGGKANHEPVTTNQKPHTSRRRSAQPGVGPEVRQAAEEVAATMKAVGLKGVSATHPHLIGLLNAGVGLAEFEGAAKLAASKAKDFPYALGVCRRQLQEGAMRPAQGMASSFAWDASRSTIEAAGQSLGMARWDEQASQLGRGESFVAYTDRVRARRAAAGLQA